MPSDSEEEILLLYLCYRRALKQKKKRKFWVHPYIERNLYCRAFVAAKELQEDDKIFLLCYRMTKTTYLTLVKLLTPAIHKQNTPMRECVCAEERILITLRYSKINPCICFKRRQLTIYRVPKL